MKVFFCPAADYCSAIDVPRKDGRGRYSGKTLEELQAEYGDVSIVDYFVSIQHDRSRRITSPKEITEEQFCQWLECLPPCKWKRSKSAEAFHVSERITHDIVTWCVRIGKSYYSFNDTDGLSADDAIRIVSVSHFSKVPT